MRPPHGNGAGAATRLALRRAGLALRGALAAAWQGLRVWSGDAAYEQYEARAGEGSRLDRREFYVDSLRRRYQRPTRCC